MGNFFLSYITNDLINILDTSNVEKSALDNNEFFDKKSTVTALSVNKINNS